MPSFTNYSLDTLSIVEYAGSTQAVSGATPYGNLVISAAGTKTASAALKILNNFNLSNGTFVPGSFVDTLEGNWNMTGGSFTSTGNTVIFSGTGTQSITSTGTFNNVTVNKTAGTALLTTDMAVNGTLTFTKGNIQTANNKVILTSSGAVSAAAQATGWIYGNIRRYFSMGNNVVKTYDLGDSLNYSPVTITIASVTIAGNVTAGLTSTEHPSVSASGLNELKSVNKYWAITNNGLAFTTASVTFNWLGANVDATATPGNFKVAKLNAAWTLPTVANITSTSIQATGITSFGEFAIGEFSSVIVWTGAVNSNWNNTGNWQRAATLDNTTNILIPAGLANYPIINASDAEINDLTLNAGSTITVAGGTFKIKGAVVTNGGVIVSTDGKDRIRGNNFTNYTCRAFLLQLSKGFGN